MTTALTIPSTVMVDTLPEVERVALACAKSGYYKDIRDASQAVVKMLAGREMGIGPIQALASIHIIEGKPTTSASQIAAFVKRSGRYDYKVIQRDDRACVIEWHESGRPMGQSKWDWDDAVRAGLDGKPNWKKYPRAMLFSRALTEGVRVYAPDAAHGIIYTSEELDPELELDAAGEVVEVKAPKPRKTKAEPAAPPPEEKPPPTISKAQSTRLWTKWSARADHLGLSSSDREAVVRDVFAEYGVEHTADIPPAQYDEICTKLEGWLPPEAEGTAEGAEQQEAF